MAADVTHGRPRRVWLRFSLRTFLVLVAVASLWLGWIVSRARNQRIAVEAVQAAGGTVLFDFQETAPRTWSTAGVPRGPSWLRERLGAEYFDTPVYAGLFNTRQGEEWIAAVNRLPSIKTLLLSGRHVDDATLVRLNGSTALVELHLSNSAISDEGLKELGKFPNLHWLVLNHTKITDGGAMHLAALKSLREINLKGTAISREGIEKIRGAVAGVKVAK